jgi:IS5 family transposase
MKQERLDYLRRRANAGRGRMLVKELIEHIDSQSTIIGKVRLVRYEIQPHWLRGEQILGMLDRALGDREDSVMDLDAVAGILCSMARRHGCILHHYDLRKGAVGNVGEGEVESRGPSYGKLFAMVSELQTNEAGLKRDLKFANAQTERWKSAFDEVCAAEREASARADAAERDSEGWKSNAEAERQATGMAEARAEKLATLLERSRARYIAAEADGGEAMAKVAALDTALQNEERRYTEILKDEERLKASEEVLASTLQKIKAEIEGPGREIYNGDSLIVDAIEAILSEELPVPTLKKELCLAEDKIREQEADIASLTMRVEMADGDYEKATQILSKILGVTTNTCIMEDELRRYILEFSKEVPTSPERDRILRWLRVAYQWNANARSFADAIERREYDQPYSPPPGDEDGRPAMTGEEYDRNLENIG